MAKVPIIPKAIAPNSALLGTCPFKTNIKRRKITIYIYIRAEAGPAFPLLTERLHAAAPRQLKNPKPENLIEVEKSIAPVFKKYK